MTVDPAGATAAEGAGAAGGSTPPPQTVGKYRLERELGRGGMGVVWAAFDPDLERAVAVKLLHAESNEPALRTRLLREARAMARLRHPNVVTVFDVGTDQNRDYIAMELVDGGTLGDWLATGPKRPEILDALLAAGKGLAAAHAAGLVHRDFKPHNVLRGKDGHVFVTDFGLARGQIEEGSGDIVQVALPVADVTTGSQPRPKRDAVLDSPLTQTGVLIGTPAYMAPEQFRGRVPDPKSDQFAFCVTAWEALTGKRPFGGATLEELETAATSGTRNLVAPDLSPAVRTVLLRGLDPSPDARWADMSALLAQLTAATTPRRRTGRTLLLSALAIAVAIIAAILIVHRFRSGASSAGCEAPEAAFDRVWGPERQAAFSAAHHGPESFGAIGLLSEARHDWVKAYSAACTAPATAASRAQIACLTSVRDEAARTVDRLIKPDSTLNMGDLAILAIGFEGCKDHSDREDRLPPPPIPTPPAPPPPSSPSSR